MLDEFHTYDGAQGTDVAMLLRRLGLTLKSYLPGDALTDEERARPLGRITPVATSATLGDQGDPAAMIGLREHRLRRRASTPTSVVTESRLDLTEWTAGAADRVTALGLTPRRLSRADLPGVNALVAALPRDPARERTFAVLGALYDMAGGALADTAGDDIDVLLSLVRAHPLVHELVQAADPAIHLGDLAEALFPEPASGPPSAEEDERVTFLTHLVAALSHVRVVAGRAALGVDLHLWVRELTRIDRVAGSAARYLWSDDGALAGPADIGTAELEQRAFPAVYCRHCGRSGWGVSLAAVGANLDTDDTAIRRNHAAHEGRFRALIYAPLEAAHAPAAGDPAGAGDSGVEGLRWLSIRQRMLLPTAPPEDDPDYRDGWVLPVLTQVGPGRRRGIQGRHLPVVPAEGRHPLSRQRHRHPAVRHAVHDVRRRGP